MPASAGAVVVEEDFPGVSVNRDEVRELEKSWSSFGLGVEGPWIRVAQRSHSRVESSKHMRKATRASIIVAALAAAKKVEVCWKVVGRRVRRPGTALLVVVMIYRV